MWDERDCNNGTRERVNSAAGGEGQPGGAPPWTPRFPLTRYTLSQVSECFWCAETCFAAIWAEFGCHLGDFGRILSKLGLFWV